LAGLVPSQASQIVTQNAHEINGKLQYENKFIANLLDTNFLGLCLTNTVD
jgi:hypothetical protein